MSGLFLLATMAALARVGAGPRFDPPEMAALPSSVKLRQTGAFTTVGCDISAGSRWCAQSNALVSWTNEVDVNAKAAPGTAVGGGTSFFLSELSLKADAPAGACGYALLSPAAPGEVLVLDAASGWYVSDGAFLAAEAEVDINVRVQGLAKAVVTGSGFLVLTVGPSRGKVLLSGFGTLTAITLAPGESVRVDPKHLLAWPYNMEFKVVKGSSRGITASLLAGEATALKFYGPGTVHVHSHSLDALARKLPRLTLGLSAGGRGVAASHSRQSSSGN